MLTHIHPFAVWFASTGDPLFAGPTCPGTPGAAKCPESLCTLKVLPLASWCLAPCPWVLLHVHCSYGLMRQSSTLLVSRSYPQHQVYAGCCQPLLGEGPSRRYLCDPCVGARTHTPPHSPAASVRCFTEDTGLTPRETGSTRGFTPTQQLRWGAVYRGCSHSFTFGLLRSLDLQIAPTAAPKGAEPPGLSHHAEPGRLPDPGSGVASCPTRTIDTAGLSPAGSQPCRLLPPAHGSPTPFTGGVRPEPARPGGAWVRRRCH